MVETIRVTIRGKEFTLRGDNPDVISKAAKEVDSTMEQIQQRSNDQSTSTISVLGALNIAEKYIQEQNIREQEQAYIVSELSSMVSFLESCSVSLSD